MSDQRSFLDIPYDERIVPFPNLASVLMQHAREFPDKTALCFAGKQYSYSNLLTKCNYGRLVRQEKHIRISLKDTEDGLLLIIYCLYHGIVFHLDPSEETNTTFGNDAEMTDNDPEPPYVQPDDPALILNDTYSFSQYNLMVAAQAVGRTFKLFRPGDAVTLLPLTDISDLVFGVLAPLYFAKTIRFDIPDPASELLRGKAQYAWCRHVLPEMPVLSDAMMRDARMIFRCEFPEALSPCACRLVTAFEHAAGLGPLLDHRGDILPLPGVEITRVGNGWQIRGHALALSANED